MPHHRRHHDIIRVLGKAPVELGNRSLRLNMQRGTHRHDTRAGRDGNHLADGRLLQDAVRNDIVGEFGTRVYADDRDNRPWSPKARLIRQNVFDRRLR